MPKRILFVYCPGGPQPHVVLPRLAQRGQVHVLALRPLPARTADLWHPYCASVIPAAGERLEGDALTDLIVLRAGHVRADAVCCVSEFAITAVARAAERLGLPGAGPNVLRSRDKRLMRATWAAAGVPSPRARPVATEDELRQAVRELTPPLLLKSAWGAGSIGQLIIDSADDVASAWASCHAAIADADVTGALPFAEPGATDDFLVEEIIPGSTRSWWNDEAGYGDYLSVEGIVLGGTFHPICIASRLPTIAPFMERGTIVPCVLPEDLQRVVESTARAAVDALGLDTCGTHTEIKLMEDRRLAVIESAARFGGGAITEQIEHVFGYDVLGMLADGLLGRPVQVPERMLTDRDARAAAGMLSLIAADATGKPWSTDPPWDERQIDWGDLLTPGTLIEALPGATVPAGTPLPRYQAGRGNLALGGFLFLRGADAATVVRDSHAVMNGLEHALAEGSRTSELARA
jgi:biotin carboxylase